jgi:hypothetical protein
MPRKRGRIGGIDSRILNLRSRWKCFTLWAHFSRDKRPGCPLGRRLAWPRSGPDTTMEKRNIPAPAGNRFSGVQSHSKSVSTELSRPIIQFNNIIIIIIITIIIIIIIIIGLTIEYNPFLEKCT